MSLAKFSVFAFFTMLFTTQIAFAKTNKINIFVSILPQSYFVERVGGDLVDVEILVGPGKSPATYDPTSKQMAKLGEARIYFRIGVPFEKGFINKLEGLNKNLRIVDTRDGVELRYFQGHNKDSSHESAIPDPHIWLDPKRVMIQAETICKALSSIAPEKKRFFKDNLNSFIKDLKMLDQKLTEILAPLKGGKFYVFHPAFGYFGDSYGLVQVAVEIEGKSPSAKQLASLIDSAKRDGVRVIFVQPQYARKGVETIAKAIDGAVVPINPLPANYLEEMEGMAKSFNKWLNKN